MIYHLDCFILDMSNRVKDLLQKHSVSHILTFWDFHIDMVLCMCECMYITSFFRNNPSSVGIFYR